MIYQLVGWYLVPAFCRHGLNSCCWSIAGDCTADSALWSKKQCVAIHMIVHLWIGYVLNIKYFSVLGRMTIQNNWNFWLWPMCLWRIRWWTNPQKMTGRGSWLTHWYLCTSLRQHVHRPTTNSQQTHKHTFRSERGFCLPVWNKFSKEEGHQKMQLCNAPWVDQNTQEKVENPYLKHSESVLGSGNPEPTTSLKIRLWLGTPAGWHYWQTQVGITGVAVGKIKAPAMYSLLKFTYDSHELYVTIWWSEGIF